MKINKVNTVSQTDVIQAYVDQYGIKWNDACDIVGDYDDADRTYYLKDIENDELHGEATDVDIFMKEIMKENNIDSVYVRRD